MMLSQRLARYDRWRSGFRPAVADILGKRARVRVWLRPEAGPSIGQKRVLVGLERKAPVATTRVDRRNCAAIAVQRIGGHYRLSDEAVVARWVENPYFQYFCGETFFQHRFPLNPSSLTRWRKRIGEEGVEWLLTKTIEAGREAEVISDRSVEAVIVDTTVMEKAIAHPTDARLYEKARRRLVTLAQEADLSLRQSYARLGPRVSGQVGRYAHARQFKRMRKALRRLKGYTGRVMRDIQRQLGQVTDDSLRKRLEAEIVLVERLLRQKPKDKGKLYALHEPEVDCISKGKARVRYEFGTKVSVATTHKEGFVVGMRSMPGNPYDGHTLREALE